MTKRFIAILVASLLVFSAFLFTGCKKNNEDGNGNSEGSPESSAPANVESLSAKEVFGLALKTETQESVSVPTEIKDMKAEIGVDVNKLTVNGEDMTMGNPIGWI